MATHRILQLPPQTRANHMVTAQLHCWERSRCAQEWPSKISATLDLHDTVLLLPPPPLPPPPFPRGNDGLLSVQHPMQGLAEVLTHCWLPQSHETTAAGVWGQVRGSNFERTLRVSAFSLWVYTALTWPWKGTWESWLTAS